jgi:hypothetical protein
MAPRSVLGGLCRENRLEPSHIAARPIARALPLALATLAVPAAGVAHDTHHAGPAQLGKVDFPTCSRDAQPEFVRAVALLHYMTYPQAREAFGEVIKTDPRCAMAHWGIAMTLFQPLWPTRPGPADLQRGWDEVQKAKSLAPPTKCERLFIEAAEAFLLDPAATDYLARMSRWENAMQKAYAALPDDPEITAFYALSHLAAATSSSSVKTNSDEAAALLCGSTPKIPITPVQCITSFTRTTCRAGRINRSRSRASTTKSHPTIRMRCICPRTSTRASANGVRRLATRAAPLPRANRAIASGHANLSHARFARHREGRSRTARCAGSKSARRQRAAICT